MTTQNDTNNFLAGLLQSEVDFDNKLSRISNEPNGYSKETCNDDEDEVSNNTGGSIRN